MKKQWLIIFLLVGALIPLTTSAQTREQLINQLLQLVAQLQAQLKVLQEQNLIATPTPISPAPTWSHSLGEQNVGVILYYIKGREVKPKKTSQEIYREILDEKNFYSLNSFLREVSYGKMWLKGVVTPWLSIDSPYPQADVQELITAADPYIDFSKTKRLILINPRTDINRLTDGQGQGGLRIYQTAEGPQSVTLVVFSFNPDIVNNYDFSYLPQMAHRLPEMSGMIQNGMNVLAHEFSHSLLPETLAHAGFLWSCPDNQPYKLINGLLDPNCVINGDVTDSLGGSGDYNSVIKESFKWFLPSQVKEIENSGTYRLDSLAGIEGVKVIKVPRVTCPITGNSNDPCGGDGSGWYYIEYRANKGRDQALFYSTDSGIIEIRIDGFLGSIPDPSMSDSFDLVSSLLLDLDNDPGSHTLKKGQSFVDPHRGTVISIVDVQPDFVKVRVELGS